MKTKKSKQFNRRKWFRCISSRLDNTGPAWLCLGAACLRLKGWDLDKAKRKRKGAPNFSSLRSFRALSGN